jgi:hypothetical protein
MRPIHSTGYDGDERQGANRLYLGWLVAIVLIVAALAYLV